MQIAIIGAGHIGITLAEKLISSSPDIHIDLFEHPPAPFGLIRYGKLQDNTGTAPQLRLFGNITVGTDITAAELGEHYDAVISTPGARINPDIHSLLDDVRPSRRDIRPLLEQRNIAYTSWEGWHHRSDASQPSIDWQDLISSAHGIPVWL